MSLSTLESGFFLSQRGVPWPAMLSGTAVVFLSTGLSAVSALCSAEVCALEKDTDCGPHFVSRGAAVPLHSV